MEQDHETVAHACRYAGGVEGRKEWHLSTFFNRFFKGDSSLLERSFVIMFADL